MGRVAKLLMLCCLSVLCTAGRPPPAQRKFISTVVDDTIANITARMKDKTLAAIFANCLPNTLDTTVTRASANDSFIITGDIAAMWLRDSTNQVFPYLRFAAADKSLAAMLRGVVMRQLRSVLIDSYANAFNIEANGAGHQDDHRKPPMTKAVFEGKYELDSLAAVMKLSHAYWHATNDSSVHQDPLWLQAMEKIVAQIKLQQQSTHEDNASPEGPAYTFQRLKFWYNPIPYPNPLAPAKRCGLSKCGFRPSDDETQFPFLVPANAMASVGLTKIAEMASTLEGGADLSAAAAELAAALREAVNTAGTIDVKMPENASSSVGPGPSNRTRVYIQEVDGFGLHSFPVWDGGNSPSILSLPYEGFCDRQDPIYLASRSYYLSHKNYLYFDGRVARGCGSHHTKRNYIWPMALTMQALTSTSDDEIEEMLEFLVAAANATGLMHESFHKDDPSRFTRPWFAWANSLFGDLILQLVEERPHLIF